MSIIIASGYAAALCVEAADRDEARKVENEGRRPIQWQRSSGQEA